MEYRELGKTGLKVPVLSYGASSLGGVFHSIKESEAIQSVFTAVEHGLNFIDVSPYYGHYKAETVLGKALKELPRESFILSTKVGTVMARMVLIHGTTRASAHRKVYTKSMGTSEYRSY
mgnify:CR=1 FL=1